MWITHVHARNYIGTMNLIKSQVLDRCSQLTIYRKHRWSDHIELGTKRIMRYIFNYWIVFKWRTVFSIGFIIKINPSFVLNKKVTWFEKWLFIKKKHTKKPSICTLIYQGNNFTHISYKRTSILATPLAVPKYFLPKCLNNYIDIIFYKIYFPSFMYLGTELQRSF